MAELLPCWRCGGNAEVKQAYETDDDGNEIILCPENACAMCEDCGATLFMTKEDREHIRLMTAEEAAAAWNTRHVETCKLNELDALTQTLSMVDGCAWGECSECGCLTPDDSTYCINCGRKVEQ